ncbi:unnamed protein product [Rotaria sp. Silwood1]|nr:unnamed protein product [Rotaria sp. Silwood1]
MGSKMFSNQSINVRKGDLTKEQTDVIVVCASSKALLESVLKSGGDAVQASYNNGLRKKATQVIAVAAGGHLRAKEIYFLPWEPNPDETLLCKSLKNFVSNAIEKAANDNRKSIAFPAIGCGQYGCSISLVAKTVIEEACRLRTLYPIAITFIIQPDRTDIYDEFQKQIDLLETSEPSQSLEQPLESPIISVSIGNGIIVVEKGNITTQKVDVIIGSSSSIVLTQTIIEAAGDEVKTTYETESKRNPNSILISTPPGQLSCRRIFFLKWKPDADDSILRQSIIDFIWNVIQNIISCNYTSVAFPAIGCGGYGCSVDIVVKTMVREIKNQLKTRNLSLTVKFVIQPEQQNIYDEFCKQVLASKKELVEKSVEDQLPTTWEKSTGNQLRFVIISYEGLDKHEIACGFQSQQCSGCQLQILKKDFDNHMSNCPSMQIRHTTSGYTTSFMAGGSRNIAFFEQKASVSVARPNEKFTFFSVAACAAWNDNLQLTITGHRNSIEINTHTEILLFGKPKPILLFWENLDKITLESSGGTAHPMSGGGNWTHVLVAQLTIGPFIDENTLSWNIT